MEKTHIKITTVCPQQDMHIALFTAGLNRLSFTEIFLCLQHGSALPTIEYATGAIERSSLHSGSNITGKEFSTKQYF